MGEHRKNGDDKKLREKKFEAMYNEYGEYAYIIAYNILKSKHAAEDAVQDAFGKVWNNLDSFDKDNAKKKIGAYTRNAAIDIYRKNKTENTTLDEWEQSAINFETPGDIVASHENIEKIYKEMKNLGNKYTDVIVLKYVCGYFPEEIADAMQLNVKTVYTRLSRGAKRLGERLTEKEGEDNE